MRHLAYLIGLLGIVFLSASLFLNGPANILAGLDGLVVTGKDGPPPDPLIQFAGADNLVEPGAALNGMRVEAPTAERATMTGKRGSVRVNFPGATNTVRRFVALKPTVAGFVVDGSPDTLVLFDVAEQQRERKLSRKRKIYARALEKLERGRKLWVTRDKIAIKEKSSSRQGVIVCGTTRATGDQEMWFGMTHRGRLSVLVVQSGLCADGPDRIKAALDMAAKALAGNRA